MLKRKIYDTLCAWRESKDRECLLIKGARQIGKTYIVEYFGKKEYSSYIYLNFLLHPELNGIFEGALDPETIYKNIQLFIGDAEFIEGDTLIFFDEIQVCRKARTATKFLAIDNRYDIISSGSLLGIHYKNEDNEDSEESYSIPVGYEREVEMFSLDLEEFMWAQGIYEDTIASLRDYFVKMETIPAAIHEKYRRLLLDYLIVGGMPEVVNTYIETKDYRKVYETQNKILNAYHADIEKYAKNTDIPKIKKIYDSIPRQLSKEYTKFQYKTVEKQGSRRKYENSIEWLVDAGMLKKVYNVSLPMMPLKGYEKEDEFKIYGSDIGLVTALFGHEVQLALARDDLKGPAKGGIYENLIYDILSKNGLYVNYYKKDDSTQEIEFLYEKDGAAIPVEVKSGNGSTLSLNEFISNYDPPYVYKLISGNIGVSGSKRTLPHYMAVFIGV